MTHLHAVTTTTGPELFEDLGADRAAAGQARARAEGDEFKTLAFQYLTSAGAMVTAHTKVDGVPLDAVAVGPNGRQYWVRAHGVLDEQGDRPGLERTDTVLKAIGVGYLLAQKIDRLPLLLVTSHLPEAGAAFEYLTGAADLFFDIVAVNGDLAGFQRLHHHFTDDHPTRPAGDAWHHTLAPDTGYRRLRQLALTNPTTDEGAE